MKIVVALACSVLGMAAAGCSSTSTSGGGPSDAAVDAAGAVRGGAKLALTNVTSVTGVDACPDAGETIVIATIGPDGQQKLLADGIDGAVACSITGGHFSVSVAMPGLSLTASGDIVGTVASHVQMTVANAGTSYSTRDTDGCSLTFQASDGGVGSDGRLIANFDCPVLRRESSSAACATALGSFLQFSECQHH